MKVILLESTNNVGMVGDIVNVKPGFARNYLLPQKKAVIADQQNLRVFEHQKRMLEKKVQKAKKEAEGTLKNLDGKEITLTRRSAKAGKLFGSVTSLDIQKAIQEQLDVEVNRKGVALAEPLKQTGKYNLTIKLDGGVEAKISVIVEADQTQPEEEYAAPEPTTVTEAKEETNEETTTA